MHSSCQRCRSRARGSFMRCFPLDEHLWRCIRWRWGISLRFMNEMKSSLHLSPSTHTHTHTDHSKHTHTHSPDFKAATWALITSPADILCDQRLGEYWSSSSCRKHRESQSQLDTHSPADKHTQQPLLAGHWNYSMHTSNTAACNMHTVHNMWIYCMYVISGWLILYLTEFVQYKTA